VVGLKIRNGEPQNKPKIMDDASKNYWNRKSGQQKHVKAYGERQIPQNGGLRAVWNENVEMTDHRNRKERTTDATA
jgi:hypothetical protein